MTQLQQITNWMRDAGQETDRANVRQMALYMGLQCEELAEKIAAVLGAKNPAYLELQALSLALRAGDHDQAISAADRGEMLDADIDLLWVSVGAAASSGADVEGALGEVIRSNESKRVNGQLQKDDTGKVIKGPAYSAPNLAPFLPEPTNA